MGGTTALVGSVGSGYWLLVISGQHYSDTMIRILLFSLLISLALLPYGGPSGAAASPAALLPRHAGAGASHHHLVKRSPEEAEAEPESEPEAGEEALGEPEPESEPAD